MPPSNHYRLSGKRTCVDTPFYPTASPQVLAAEGKTNERDNHLMRKEISVDAACCSRLSPVARSSLAGAERRKNVVVVALGGF